MPATPKASTAEAPAPKAPRTPRKTDGREAILRAAERLFAEHGFEGCSLRAVADRAKVNLAKSQLQTLAGKVEQFQMDTGRLPQSLEEMVKPPANATGLPE